ncbi:MAG: permease prefix domain 1-containing protein [Romboutsia sp.]
MNTKIKKYVDNLFKDAPKNRKTYELKEEILSNIDEKYNDLVDMGLDENGAYTKAIANIDDIDELIQNSRNYIEEEKEYRKKSGLRISIAIMLYILSPIPIILSSESPDEIQILGVVLLLVIVAIATGIIIYNGYDKPVNSKIDDDLYEEFIQWKDKGSEIVRLEKRINSIIGSMILVTYLVISFIYDCWDISWIIFLTAPIAKNIVRVYFDYKESQNHKKKV